jgi:hypothetical protein
LLGVLALNPAGASAAPPPNDNFANAPVVGPDVPIAVAATTVDSTAEPGEPEHSAGNPAQHTVWYSWTAPAGMTAVVDVCDHDPAIETITEAVYTGSAVDDLQPVGSTAGECILRFDATATTNYKIAIDTNADVGALTFKLRQLTPPANDDFASATTLPSSLFFSIIRSNLDSTTEPDEPAINGGINDGRSVWFNWTATADRSIRLDICDFRILSGVDAKAVSIWTGDELASLTPVFSSSTQCRTTFDAEAGEIYRIAFSGTFGGEGTFTLELREAVPPPNDAFLSAIGVGPGLTVARADDNRFATVEIGEPNHGEYPGNSLFPSHDSVWYRWTPTATVEAQVSVCNADFGPRLGVYTGNVVSNLTKVTPAAPINSQPFCSMRFNAVMGTQYRIAVGGSVEDTEGSFVLDIHSLSPPPNGTPAAPAPAPTPTSTTGFNLKRALKKCKKAKNRKKRRKCVKKAKKRAKREGQTAGSAASPFD